MKGEKVSAVLAAATALLMVAYAGRGFFSSAAVLPEEPTEITLQTTAPTETTVPETTAPPAPPPTRPEALLIPLLEETMEGMDGTHIFVYDLDSERMLCSTTDKTDRLYPASITKLYTAWLALKHLSPDTVITAGEELGMVGRGSSLAYISRGCRLTAEMLVEAMLLPSGNDAAYVLAAGAGRAIAGDETLSATEAVQRFVSEMNREAGQLGMEGSNFTNPDGYHTGGHYSCPADLALIGSLALENTIIQKYAAMEADTVTYVSGEKITWYNTNRMVNRSTEQYCADAIGLKTGYTGEAGYCLLAAFRDGDRQILVGIFGAEDNYPRYENAEALWQCFGKGLSE